MNTQDIAANVPPITRDYIHLAIQEAMAPAIEEIFAEISKAKAMVAKAPDTSTLAADVANSVEASLANGIAQIVNQRTSALRQELVDAIDALRSDIAGTRQVADKALSGTEYLASNQVKPAADPTTAIEQAIAPLQQAIDTINLTLASTKSMDLIASAVSASVEASISASISSQVEQRSKALREELDTALAHVHEEAEKVHASAETILKDIADLEARVRKWLHKDRYNLTRSQVLKAMRDAND